MRSCAAGAMLSPWRAGSVGCQLPGRFPRRTVPAAFPFFQISMIDKVLFTSIPAVPTAGNRRRVNLRKKTRERAHPCGHRPTSRVSVLLGYPVFAAPRWARGFISSSQRWEQSTSCLRNLCHKSPIQAALRRGNFSIEMASVSVNCSFLLGCLRQCDQKENR